jgi:hypothetical protein
MVWLSCEGETPVDTENMGKIYYTPWRVRPEIRKLDRSPAQHRFSFRLIFIYYFVSMVHRVEKFYYTNIPLKIPDYLMGLGHEIGLKYFDKNG